LLLTVVEIVPVVRTVEPETEIFVAMAWII